MKKKVFQRLTTWMNIREQQSQKKHKGYVLDWKMAVN